MSINRLIEYNILDLSSGFAVEIPKLIDEEEEELELEFVIFWEL